MKSRTMKQLAALSLLILATNSYALSNILNPAPASTLAGSADVFEWDPIEDATRYSLWVGSAEDPDAFGRHTTSNAYQQSMEVVHLPLDGSTVTAILRWHDGIRWHSQSPVNYTADYPTSGVWGVCTATADWGLRAKLLPKSHSLGSPNYAKRSGMRASRFNNRVNTLLRDGCASDQDYAEVSALDVYPNKTHKGVYLWLAPGSGAASIDATVWTWFGSYTRKRLIQPYTNNAKPIFIAIDNGDTWSLDVHPLNPEKPVRISELRMAGLDDDVSSLRKQRFTSSASFVAVNGDARARVTAEIDDLFGPNIFADDVTYANYETCGTTTWIDATWEIEKGIISQARGYNNWNRTVWINFEKVSNEEISTAIKESVEIGVEQSGPGSGAAYGECHPAPDSLIYQDWVGKAAAAKAGTYEGPQLNTGRFSICSQTSTGREFKYVRAPITDDYQYSPSNLIDSCTNIEQSWSGKNGTSVTLDAGQLRGMKGIYLWSTFAREESFTIESSIDGNTWRSEWSPAITKAVNGPTYYSFSNRTSRYIRITGISSWVNLAEARWVHRNDIVVEN